jgi:hypothetical protein
VPPPATRDGGGAASLDDDPDPLGTLGPGPTADGEAGTFTAFPWLDAPVRVEPGQAFDLTSILNLAPPGPAQTVTEVLEAIITAVKVIGHAALNGLPGLTAMAPGGDFLRKLNDTTAANADFYGIAADFEPKGSLRELVKRAADVVLDRVFKDQPNDLVVPTAGVFQAGDGFRVVDQRVLRIEPRWGIEHCHYFGHPRTSERLLEWLLAP